MSEYPGVRCDRCGATSLVDKPGKQVPGWSIVRLQRAVPFCDTGYVDLCQACTDHVYAAIRKDQAP